MNETLAANVLRQAQDERIKGDYFPLDLKMELLPKSEIY